MTLERRNPLPIGRYWQEVVELPDKPDARAKFANWLSRNKTSVHAESTEDHSDEDPPGVFYVIVVTAPTIWEGPGYPTIASTTVKSRDDVVRKPDPTPSVADQVSGIADKTTEGIASGLKVVAVIAAAALAVFFFSSKDSTK